MISRVLAIGVGANKGGTTSLYHYMAQHPRLVPSRKKEVDYFGLWEHWVRGVNWYRDHWPGARWGDPAFLPYEWTPHYLDNPLAPHRIRAIAPRARILVLLRDPVQRAISHYWDMVRSGWERLPIRDAFTRETERLAPVLDEFDRVGTHGVVITSHGYRYRGVYWRKIKRYLDTFPRDQIWIARSEDLFDDPQRIVDDLCDFLGVERIRLSDPSIHNPGTKGPTPPDLVEELREYFRPHNQRLYELINRDMGWP